VSGRSGDRRRTSWVDDVKGGISEIVLEALVVLALIGFALVVAFIVVTVV
jgi:hypothetical protein